MTQAPVLFFCLLALVNTAGSVPLDSSVQNSIENRVIVDRWAFDIWKSKVATSGTESQKVAKTKTALTDYINSAFHDMNSIFKGLVTSGINLDARIVSIEFITDEDVTSENPVGSGQGTSENVLKEFKAWLDTKSYAGTDHTMLMTGLDLTKGGSTSSAGKAYVAQMCSSRYSLSVSEASPSGSVVITMSHELGHNMDASHDTGGCDAGHVMTSSSQSGSGSPNIFQYSSCSISSIKAYLQSLYDTGDSCLSAANTDTAPVSSIPLGERYTPDEICKLNYGPDSYFCRRTFDQDYSSMCSSLFCHNPEGGAGSCTSVRSSDGFVCGSGKRCHLGQCVPSETAPTSVSDTCPQGDTEYPFTTAGQTCSELLSDFQGNCYHDDYRTACCDGCAAAKTSVTGCEYGDRSSSCSSLTFLIDCYHGTNEDICCGSCLPHKDASAAGCEYGDKASWCAAYIASDINNCELNSDSCCLSCKDYSPSTDDCKDIYSNCAALVAGNPANCYNYEQECCKSCSAAVTGTGGCEYGDKASWCAAYIASDINNCELNSDSCCLSCKDYSPSTDDCKDIYSNCAALVADNPANCYNYEQECCKSCSAAVTGTGDCKYGDRSTDCASLTYPATCYYNEAVCCASCPPYHTGVTGCEYGDKSSGCQSYHCNDHADLCCGTCGA